MRVIESVRNLNTQFQREQQGIMDLIRWNGWEDLGLEKDPVFREIYRAMSDPTDRNNSRAAAAISSYVARKMGVGTSGGGYSGASGPSKAQQVAQIEAEIRNIARQFGVQGDWGSLAQEAQSNNWNAAMIKDHLANLLSVEMINREGIVSSVASQVREMASKYYVQLSDSEIFDWAKRFASDEIDNDAMLSQIKARAKVKFSALAEVIDSGTTVDEYFRPHRELIAQLMDVAPTQVDLMNDSKWLPVLENLPGQDRRPMNLYETGQFVRSQDSWKQTSSARDYASGAAANVARVLGAL